MPTLDSKFEIDGEHGNTVAAVRARAVYAAGFTGPAAHRLILTGQTPAQFEAAIVEARDMRSIVDLCASQLPGVDKDDAVNHAIAHSIPLAPVRKDITNLLAQLDEDAQVNTARKLRPSAPTTGQTDNVYAQRAAQIDALKDKHG